MSTAGTKYLKSMFRSFWNVKKGPQESFWDDKALSKVVAYRLGLNTSRPYKYALSDGTEVLCHETFDINVKNIRFGFIVQRAAVSWFKPTAACAIYQHFLGQIERPVVWDPSCGFGARLLGFVAAYPEGTYIGTEPAEQTFCDLELLRGAVANAGLPTKVELCQSGSECFDPGCELDLVFTSPPYFDKEQYFEEPTQCWKMFPSIDTWVAGYLQPTFATAFKRLKAHGALVINIDPENERIITDTALSVGFRQGDSLSLKMGRDHFSKVHGKASPRYEPILVFIK
jgi:hypothetical protein